MCAGVCVFTVSTQTPSLCDKQSSTSPDNALSSGLLSSFLARNGGRRAAGTRACPWSLRAAEYQRITLSIIDFPVPSAIVLLYNMVLTTFYFLTMVLLLAILYDHMIMYLGLFGHSAVVFHDSMFFSCFYVY